MYIYVCCRSGIPIGWQRGEEVRDFPIVLDNYKSKIINHLNCNFYRLKQSLLYFIIWIFIVYIIKTYGKIVLTIRGGIFQNAQTPHYFIRIRSVDESYGNFSRKVQINNRYFDIIINFFCTNGLKTNIWVQSSVTGNPKHSTEPIFVHNELFSIVKLQDLATCCIKRLEKKFLLSRKMWVLAFWNVALRLVFYLFT